MPGKNIRRLVRRTIIDDEYVCAFYIFLNVFYDSRQRFLFIICRDNNQYFSHLLLFYHNYYARRTQTPRANIGQRRAMCYNNIKH